MATVLRNDDSHNVSYPQTPDSRGTARIYYHRKPYYLGNHDSPLSYVMFGIWKQHLQNDGKIPPTSQIREQAESVLGPQTAKPKQWHQYWIMGLGLTLACLVGGLVGAGINSTVESSRVDGITLSANEVTYIRKVRAGEERRVALFEEAQARVPTTFVAIQGGQLRHDEIQKRLRGY